MRLDLVRWLLAILLLALLSLLVVHDASAENVYIRDGAEGDGSSWAEALDDLPATFVRGNTYLVADGTYGGHTFNTAVSGTSVITIKKATVSAHGDTTGWLDEYGDGQAVFTGSPAQDNGLLAFTTSYWVWDGVTRDEGAWSDSSAYGFAVHITDSLLTSDIACVRFTANKSNFTFQYTDFEHAGNDVPVAGHDIFQMSSAAGGVDSLTFSHNYLHNMGRTAWLLRFSDDALFEYNEIAYLDNPYYVAPNWVHREPWMNINSSQWVIRYNVIHDIGGSTGGSNMPTGIIAVLDGVANDILIYGNVFYDCWSANGIITTNSAAATALNDCWVYNNTFVNMQGWNNKSIGINAVRGTGNVAKNNTWYNCQTAAPSWQHITGGTYFAHDYNAAQASMSETHGVVLTSNPFGPTPYKPNASSQLLGMADETIHSLYRTDRDGVTHDVIGAMAYEDRPPENEVETFYATSSASPGGDGTTNYPFRTLTEIVAALGPVDTAVLTGSFNEPITVPADSITLRGSAILDFRTAVTGWTVPDSGEPDVASIDTSTVAADGMVQVDFSEYRPHQSEYLATTISTDDYFHVLLSMVIPANLSDIDSLKVQLMGATARADIDWLFTVADDNNITPPVTKEAAQAAIEAAVADTIVWTFTGIDNTILTSPDLKPLLDQISSTVSEGDTICLIAFHDDSDVLSNYVDAVEQGTGYPRAITWYETGEPGPNAYAVLGYVPPNIYLDGALITLEESVPDSMTSGTAAMSADSLFVSPPDTLLVNVTGLTGIDTNGKSFITIDGLRIRNAVTAVEE